MEKAHGTTRFVILTKNYAIKLPTVVEWRLFLHGLLANMYERMNYQAFKDTASISYRLCPICFSLPGGWLVVMKRAKPLVRDQFQLVDQIDWTPIPVEEKLDSFGWYDGKIVAVDYGGR